MSSKERIVRQNLIDDNHQPIRVFDEVQEAKLTKETFDDFFEGLDAPRYVGLAPVYSSRGSLCRLVIATKAKAMVIQFAAKDKGAKAYVGREFLAAEVLCNPDNTLIAFDITKLAIPLFKDQGLRIVNAVDIQDAFALDDRSPLAAIEFATQGHATVWKDNIEAAFACSSLDDAPRTTSFVQQAWSAQCLVTYEGMEEKIQNAKRVNTKDMNEETLRVFAQLERGEQRVELTQATSTAHEFSTTGTRNQTASVQAERFQTRFRASGLGASSRSQLVTVDDPDTGLSFIAEGQVHTVNGRNAQIKTNNTNLNGRSITSITTQGRDGPTSADRQRSLTVLQALQGRIELFDNPYLQYIFNPSPEFTWPETFPVLDTIPSIVTQRVLNDSQERAVHHMLMNTNDSRLTIIQGPPGTGKTTVIAAFVCSAVAAGSTGIWLMAQSNIAVKNIAEKLVAVGFDKWRLLVSDDFHTGWHEHIYHQVQKNIIRSSEFRQARQKVAGVPVILCTLSMLANTRISIFTSANPIKTIVIDEASQITLGSYVAPLKKFTTIHKICMIGDDKQLPPYGADEDGNIKSIFEVDHLRPSVLFLSIQYRMPPLIGDVVSDFVYEGQLQSYPDHPVPISQSCCWFVHVNEACERQHEKSWHNPAERAAVLKIAEKLQTEGEEYCVITPYDAQRSFLEAEMREAGLDWQDKCFNVDSFQGNERDYIVVSLVRSRGLGFLDDIRRTNVMLTRCKRGMYIVTSWEFVWGKAADTLVGRMAATWGNDVWVNPEHLEVVAEDVAA